jgi:hypothetical protein
VFEVDIGKPLTGFYSAVALPKKEPLKCGAVKGTLEIESFERP